MERCDCQFFGARSHEMRSRSRVCKACKINNHDVYECCIQETDILLSTSFGPNDSIELEKSMNENELTVEQPNDQIDELKLSDEPVNVEKPKRKPAMVTKGVLELAKNLIREGKNDCEIIESLIVKYTEGGKGSKQAKHNALTTLFHAHKRVRDGK